jgi:Bacterial PH domain
VTRPAVTKADERARLHRPIRPRRGRAVGRGLALLQALVVGGGALLLPYGGLGAVGWADRLGIVAVAAAVSALLWRLGSVQALPSEQGLVVTNLFRRTDLSWPQIVAVRFGGGGPWVLLDLADGDTLSVMAVQRADGEFGQQQARRLATLVALHSRTSHDN